MSRHLFMCRSGMRRTRHGNEEAERKTRRSNLTASGFCLPGGVLTRRKMADFRGLPTSMTLGNIGEHPGGLFSTIFLVGARNPARVAAILGQFWQGMFRRRGRFRDRRSARIRVGFDVAEHRQARANVGELILTCILTLMGRSFFFSVKRRSGWGGIRTPVTLR